MKTAPIVPARWRVDEPGAPQASHGDDLLQAHARPHARSHAQAHARPHAAPSADAPDGFLTGNGLPQRWQGRDRFVVLETGFGLGHHFLTTWQAWRQDPQACRQLHVICIEHQPPTREALEQAHRASPLRTLAQRLIAAWPPLTPNLHRLSFEAGRVQLLLALGDVGAWLPELVAPVDAFFLNGLVPVRNPAIWQDRHFKALARLAAPGATLVATGTATQAVHMGLTAAGFDIPLAPGAGGERNITLAHFEPGLRARRRIDERRAAAVAITPERRAIIVGAGLAGCAAAWALSEQGWQTTLIDRHAEPAQEASGNPAGLFHGIVNRQDGAHARFNRAAALEAERAVRQAVAEHGVPGSAEGLLRLDPGADISMLRHQLAATGLPADFVQAVSAERASQRSGLPLTHPGWFFPGGGWVAPGALAASLLRRAGGATRFRGKVDVASIRQSGADGWALLDAHGEAIDAAPTLVLANAFDALRLLGTPAWPVQKLRGQVSVWQADENADSPSPCVPLAGAGYLLPRVGSQMVFGATAQAGDDDAEVRHADHVHNLAQLVRLTGDAFSHVRPEWLQGRTAWRMVSRDRLPIIGAVPDASAALTAGARPPDQARFVPRLPGLFVFTALGSRGITWAALGAQVLASSITGAPQPLEADLLDAIDPARFIVRAVRRSGRGV